MRKRSGWSRIDLVSFIYYEFRVYQIYSNQMDSIIQPVEELGAAAAEQILRRIEDPETPVFEKVFASSYKPFDAPHTYTHSDR